MDADIDNICIILGINPDTVVKKRYGKCQEYTVRIIIEKILKYSGKFSKDRCFTDMNPSTSTIMLRNAFGKPNLSGSSNWRTYLLGLIGKGICTECGNFFIKKSSDTYKCIECRKEYNAKYYQEHKAEAKLRQIQREYLLNMYKPGYHELAEMEEFYALCPEGYEVDHIVPIKHPLVCGLHCRANLQYLTVEDNRRKSNTFVIL